MDENNIRLMLIEEAEELAGTPGNSMTQSQVIARVSQRMDIRGTNPAKKSLQQLLLTVWHDLFREGYIAWGADLATPDPPHCHLTARGRQLLRNVSRDPGNPSGYLAYLDSTTTINAVARSYIEEALATYRGQCWKATAVMVGAATESVVIDVRDAITTRLDTPGVSLTITRKERERLEHWAIKGILDQIKAIRYSLTEA